MKALLQGKAGQLEVAADEPAIVPGVVRVKAGPGLLFTVFLSPDEALKLGDALHHAAHTANRANEQERRS